MKVDGVCFHEIFYHEEVICELPRESLLWHNQRDETFILYLSHVGLPG
jgi:hypothetical protein